jgi:hypothetical protein
VVIGSGGWGKNRFDAESIGMELLLGLEPRTSSLPRKCSTTELQQRDSRRARVVSSVGRGGQRGARCGGCGALERAKGIEPSCAAWKAAVLPLNYARRSAPGLRRQASRGATPSRCSAACAPRARRDARDPRCAGQRGASWRASAGLRSQRGSAWCGVGLDGERSRTPARRAPGGVRPRGDPQADTCSNWPEPGEAGLVGRDGFEPSKAEPSDLQSDPFGRSGISPLCACDEPVRTQALRSACIVRDARCGSTRSLNHPRTGLVVMERAAQRARRCGGRRPGDGPARLRGEPAVGFEPTTT